MEELEYNLKYNKKVEIETVLENNLFRRLKTALYKETDTEYYFYKPKQNDSYVDYEQNQNIRILIYTEEGIFIFNSTVIKNGDKLIKILKPQRYKKIQRRGLIRMALPIKVKIEYKKDNQTFEQPVKIVDISGSGISFNTDCELFQNKKLIVHFTLEDKEISSIGEIIEIRQNRKTLNGKYRFSVRFLSISKKDSDFIVKHCLVYQIKTRIKIRNS